MLERELSPYRDAARAVAERLRLGSSIVLTTHVRPDGDAVGSILGLGSALRAVGKTVHLIMPSPVPSSLRFLPCSDSVEQFEAVRHAPALATSDTIVCLDFNTLSRLEQMADAVRTSPAQRILIDHHIDPEPGFAAALHDVDATSTAELVSILLMLEFPETLSPTVATPLYTGILTDTGNFRFPRVCGRTHRIVAHLIDAGADPVAIYDALFNTNTPERLRLLGVVLSTLEITCQGRCALLLMRREHIAACGAEPEDTEGFVQQTLTIAGVQLGAFISEMVDRDAIKVSLRSKGNVDVQQIAAALGGGGHLNAAAAVVEGATLEEVKARVLALAEQLLGS